jgi:hypothetical protein
MMRTFRLTALFVLIFSSSFAQDRPVGYWRSHLPYNTAVSTATDGSTMYVATEQAFYTFNTTTAELNAYSKVEGMADVGTTYTAYDKTTGTTIIAYKNSNIDLFKEGTFFNLPDLKLKTVTSTKNINHIYTENGFAYLSTDIGIVVLNLTKKEVKETYTFTKNSTIIPVKELIGSGNYFYAITPKGLYKANKNSINLQAFSAWTPLDTNNSLLSIVSYADKIFANTSDSIFILNNNVLKSVYYSADSAISSLDSGNDGLWVNYFYDTLYSGKAKKMSLDYQFTDSFKIGGYSKKIIEAPDNSIWISDAFYGLKRRYNTDSFVHDTPIPEGPNYYSVWDMYAYNKELWVAHGAYSQFYTFENNKYGFSQFKNDRWTNYQLFDYAPFGDSTYDFTDIIKGPDGTVYAGSTQSGLFILKPDGSYEMYRKGSVLDEVSGYCRVSGLALDKQGNLWLTNFGAQHELMVKIKDGNWYKFFVPINRPYQNSADNIIIDDNDLKWYCAPGKGGGGIIVYDDNKTPENPSDDSYRQLIAGKGVGNLPDNDAYCIVQDKSGALWVGTANGIGIINCPSEVLAGTCEAELRVVQYDQFAGYLFQNETVKTIAVDGANRKWIGTNNGVWLITSDGNQIINRFTAENSPLPSNIIQKITIDPVTGDVYIGTDQGIVSYRGSATDGSTENSNVVVFPNPIPSDYKGQIAIRGLVENADVRITDISGQLVYRTKALGGQAVWNGYDYTGHRPETGVYLVFITNKDGSQTHVGKMVFMN